jgi:hypothetical protein
MIRVDTSAVKTTLMHDKQFSPKQYTAKLKELLPVIIRQRIEAKKVWLNEQIRTIKKPPQKVHQYVAQIKALDYIDANYSDVKEYIELNSRIFGLCVDFEIIGKEDKARRFLDEAYALTYRLNDEVSEARENADKRKEEMKKKIGKKVPKLHDMTDVFVQEIEQAKYLDLESNIERTLLEVQ